MIAGGEGHVEELLTTLLRQNSENSAGEESSQVPEVAHGSGEDSDDEHRPAPDPEVQAAEDAKVQASLREAQKVLPSDGLS